LVKTGVGKLIFSSSGSVSGSLNISSGQVSSSQNSLRSCAVAIPSGGIFTGTDSVASVNLSGGTLAPGGGSGVLSSQFNFSGNVPSTLQFEFQNKNYPDIYNYPDGGGNGLMAFNSWFAQADEPANPTKNNVSIFLATPTVQAGDTFKGAFFCESPFQISASFFQGLNLTYYVQSPGGTTIFDGKTFSPLNLSQYGVKCFWLTKQGFLEPDLVSSYQAVLGKVLEFKITSLASFNQWETNYGISSGAMATPQKDGVSNLLKYFLDIDPTIKMNAADRTALPVAGMITSGGISYLTLTYRKNISATGIATTVQVSSDLKTWLSVTPDFTRNLGYDANTGDPIIEVGVNTAGATREFIRLDVSLP